MADLAATASELDKEDEKSESDIIDSVEAFLLGWVPVEKNQMQIDPQGVLEVEFKKVYQTVKNLIKFKNLSHIKILFNFKIFI